MKSTGELLWCIRPSIGKTFRDIVANGNDMVMLDGRMIRVVSIKGIDVCEKGKKVCQPEAEDGHRDTEKIRKMMVVVDFRVFFPLAHIWLR